MATLPPAPHSPTITAAGVGHPDLLYTAPDGRGARLMLFVLRRMALGGVRDAHAANALLGAFGRNYRRPLILMRAMMLELARASQRSILVAPCCCPRMTEDELRVVAAAAIACSDARTAHAGLALLLDTDAALGALTCLQAVAGAFADMGQPLVLEAA